MKALLLVACVVCVAGCSALRSRPGAYLTAGRFRVEASSPQSNFALEAAIRLDPIVQELLGAGRDGVIELRFRPLPTKTRGSTTHPRRRITLATTLEGKDLERVLTHELTHCHMSGAWLEMPAAVQEGVCHLAAAIALGEVSAYEGPAAQPDALLRALTWSREKLYAADSKERQEVEQAGTWVAGRLIWRENGEASVPAGTVEWTFEIRHEE
jgi:hypothetical protein